MKKWVAVLIAVGVVLTSNAGAATLYVSTSGVSSGSCPSGTPCNIQYAAGITNPGDVVLVADGTYIPTATATPVINITRSGNSTNKITYKAANRWGAVISGQGDAYYYGIMVNANYIRIEGFDISGQKLLGVGNGNGDFFELIGNHIHTIARSTCSDTTLGFDGYFAGSAPNDVLIEGNRFNDIGRKVNGVGGCTTIRHHNDHAIYFSGSNYNIRNNEVYNIRSGWAVHIYSAASTNIHVENNTFSGYIQGDGSDAQILVGTTIDGLYVKNNIFHQARDYFVHASGIGGSAVTGEAFNNLSDVNLNANFFDIPQSGVSVSGNIEPDNPDFNSVSSSGGIISGTPDFRIGGSSPAKNAGVNISSVTTDFWSNSRPICNTYDIGAHERTACPSGGCGGFEEPPCETEGRSGEGSGAGQPRGDPETRQAIFTVAQAKGRTDLYDVLGRRARKIGPGVYIQHIMNKKGVVIEKRRVVVVR